MPTAASAPPAEVNAAFSNTVFNTALNAVLTVFQHPANPQQKVEAGILPPTAVTIVLKWHVSIPDGCKIPHLTPIQPFPKPTPPDFPRGESPWIAKHVRVR
jgi:hypothetical protein